MANAYPQFRSSYSHEEMVEHFLLTPAELQLALACCGDANRCGMALLLKTLSHLGYVPDQMPQIPEEVRSFVAGQLGLLWGRACRCSRKGIVCRVKRRFLVLCG